MTGMSTRRKKQRMAKPPFDPLVNYANGEQGAYYAPWDISTLWQDDARTVPVENYGDPVRVMDDLSPNGNHAVAPTSAARGTYGRMPVGGVRNRLTNTDNIALVTVGSTIINNYAQSADGRWDISLITANPGVPVSPLGTNNCYARRKDTDAPREFAVSFEFKSAGLDRVSLVAARSDDLSLDPVRVTVSLTDGDVVSSSGAVQAESELVEEGFWRVKLSMTRPALNSRFGIKPADSEVTEGDGIKGILYRRPQQEAGLAATPYQRVGNQYDVTQEGVPDVYYIETDGIDDCYQTAQIDLTMYDSTSLAVGAQYLGAVGASGAQFIVEFSAQAGQNPGTFSLLKGNPSNGWGFMHKGTDGSLQYPGESLDNDPHIFSLSGDISESLLLWGVGSTSGQFTESQGTGNLGDYSLNLLSRNTGTLFFQGRFFGAIIVHPRSPYEEQNRQFLAKKAGVTL